MPEPAGARGRITVRDVTTCDGTWWVGGGVVSDDGETAPAAWSSRDGSAWKPLQFRARAYWAQRAVISSVACAGDQVRMIGAQSGGAHGNPRVTSWYAGPDGVVTDVAAPFELYGGPSAVNVGRVAAGPDGAGWLIAGNRTSGAAVWWSSDGHEFELVDDDPALASDAEVGTFASDAAYDGSGWTVVGSADLDGRASWVPQAWTSTDGLAWERQEVPATAGFGSLERVVRADDALLAAGLDSDGFGLWRRTDAEWTSVGRFGAVDPEGHAFRGVADLTVSGEDALVTVSDGSAYSLWSGSVDDTEGWREVVTPFRPSTVGGAGLSVAAADGEVLLLADDGETAGVWHATWPDGQ